MGVDGSHSKMVLVSFLELCEGARHGQRQGFHVTNLKDASEETKDYLASLSSITSRRQGEKGSNACHLPTSTHNLRPPGETLYPTERNSEIS